MYFSYKYNGYSIGENNMSKLKKQQDSYILKNKEKLLNKKRKIKFIKRGIFLFIVLTSILITLCLKLSYFNIASITVKGNENLTKGEIMEKSNIKVGENIFTVKTNKAISSVKENPYVITSHIKRKFPNEIIITVKEREATFYSKLNDEFYIIDNEGIILDKKKTIENPNLVRLEGINLSSPTLGSEIPVENKKKLKDINTLADIIYDYNSKDENVKITMIELNNFIDIKIHCNNKVYIKIGTDDDMPEKLAKAFSILKDKQLKNMKGYIDVSFDGNPVIYKQD